MKPRRVAVTGLGVVAPCGVGAAAYWDGLLGPGITGTRSVEFGEWDPTPWFDSPKDARRADRVEQFALAAAAEAFDSGGRPPVDDARIATVFATGVGGLRTLEDQIEVRQNKGERRVSPFLVPMMMPNASGAAISMRYGLRGPNETICTACAAGTHAIGYAARLIAWGVCDAAVTGGSESAGTATALAGFGNMTALSSAGVSRPFDVERDGFVMGEGAAVLALEEREAALRRGARIVAEVVGFGASNDAYHMTAPRPDGREAARAIRAALRDAGIAPERIGYLNAHGSSTPLNEPAESRAIRAAFGVLTDRIAVSGTKGLYGHALGASGAIEAAITAMALDREILPGTCNLEELDPTIDLHLLRSATAERVDAAVSTSFGFGGMNAALVLARHD